MEEANVYEYDEDDVISEEPEYDDSSWEEEEDYDEFQFDFDDD